MMESALLNMLCHTVVLILMLAVTCNAGRSFDVDEALQQILSENDDGSYFPSDSTELDTSDRAMSELIRRLQPEEHVSKRIFCNGFRGCRGRKRTSPMKQQRLLPEDPPVQKRPFCNGFFGCANGKRSIDAPLLQPIPEQDAIEVDELRKRLFCNSFGCLNGKRSSLYNTLMERLRSDKLELGQTGSNLPIRSNNDKRPLLMTSLKSLRQIRAANDEDEDRSKFPLDASDFESHARPNTPKWCNNCNLVKIIMPQLYAYRNEETVLPSLDRQLLNAAAEMPRELMTSDNFAKVDNDDTFLPEKWRVRDDKIQIDKKCSVTTTRRRHCQGG